MTDLNQEQCSFLLHLSRNVLVSHIGGGNIPQMSVPGGLDISRGIFVTLKNGEDIRGCIGTMEPQESIIKSVERLTISASHDLRTSEITPDELDKIRIEISVLGIPKRIESCGREILDSISKDSGVIVSKEDHYAVFLPQVWEKIDDKEQFLSELCLKAGLSKDEWMRDTEVFTFSAQSFEED